MKKKLTLVIAAYVVLIAGLLCYAQSPRVILKNTVMPYEKDFTMPKSVKKIIFERKKINIKYNKYANVYTAKFEISKKEAANMVDLDSDPTKILEVVEIGKQLLITRGSLTTFSIANDIAKYFAIIPAMFMRAIPELGVLNIMHLATQYSAILSALIFNAIIIPCLIPLAMKGVKYRPMSSGKMLLRNMMIFGVGGVITPFVGIKLIDMIIHPLLALLGL